MPEPYLLTIFNYSIVLLASGELSPIYFKDIKDETPTSNILEEIYLWHFVWHLPVKFASRTRVSIHS